MSHFPKVTSHKLALIGLFVRFSIGMEESPISKGKNPLNVAGKFPTAKEVGRVWTSLGTQFCWLSM